MDSDVLQAAIIMPSGTPVERTLKVVDKLERAVREALAEVDKKHGGDGEPLFKYSATIVGMNISGRHGPAAGSAEIGGHLAQIYVEVLEGESRGISAAELVNLWRQKVGPVPEAREITYQSALFSAGNPIEVHLASDNKQELDEAGRRPQGRAIPPARGIRRGRQLPAGQERGAAQAEAHRPGPGPHPGRPGRPGAPRLLRGRGPAPAAQQGRGEGHGALPPRTSGAAWRACIP